MKRLILAALCCVLVLSVALAEEPKGPKVPPLLVKHLKLTPDQVDTIQQENLALAMYMREELSTLKRVEMAHKKALRVEDPQANLVAIGQTAVNLETRRRQIKARRDEGRKAIRAVLTPEQLRSLNNLRRAASIMPIYQQALRLNLLTPPGRRPTAAKPTAATDYLLDLPIE